MNEKTVNFFTQKDTLKDNLDHIAQNITDPLLLKIDELYGAADRLSIINAKRHRRALLLMAFVATLLTFLFLLYD